MSVLLWLGVLCLAQGNAQKSNGHVQLAWHLEHCCLHIGGSGNAPSCPLSPFCSGMGGTTDGTAPVLVGLPGRSPGQSLHADAVHGTLVIAISGPGVEAVPLTCRGMRCISQARGHVGAGATLRCVVTAALLAGVLSRCC